VNQEYKAKWVAALRSGEYRQGQGKLRTGDAFCCLGVLCDVVGRELGGEWAGEDFTRGQGLSSSAVAPSWLVETCGIYYRQGELAEMNDDGATFSAIADHIEREL
jgi:hypothetical protein